MMEDWDFFAEDEFFYNPDSWMEQHGWNQLAARQRGEHYALYLYDFFESAPDSQCASHD